MVVSEVRVSKCIAAVSTVICIIHHVVRVNGRPSVVREQIEDYIPARQEVSHP
jgi:hypothetical protein